MKIIKFLAILLTLVLGISFMAPVSAQEAYGADRLMEDKPYQFHEMAQAALEETSYRLAWLEQAADWFQGEPLFRRELEAEKEREQAMRQLFSAWGFAGEPAGPANAPEVPPGFEQALQEMRRLAERAMLMSQRMEAAGFAEGELRAWAHFWGHAYRQQLDECDLKAEALGYGWAWQYEQEGEGNQEQKQQEDRNQGDPEPGGEQNEQQNQKQNKQHEQEKNQGENPTENEQNQNGNGGHNSGGGKKGN